MRNIFKILIQLVPFIILSCDDDQRYNFDKALIPLSPVNFHAVNSSWDDFNSAAPWPDVAGSFILIFSTNRISQGNDFDFISYDCQIEEYLSDGEFNISAWLDEPSDLLNAVNTPDNELGPYLTINVANDYFPVIPDNMDHRFFYTSDVNGSNDIFYIYYSIADPGYAPSGSPAELTGINTDFDEGYLTIHSGEQPNRETVYFTSNRDNDYDIYRAISEENKTIDQSAVFEIEKVVQLSSDADDKCPYIKDDLMIFTSDRPGGSGGFDLWISVYDGTEWGVPENLGDKINTGYNEYRPIILGTDNEQYLNDLLIFSSDRPGGVGRYDLYYVGLKKVFE
jgi:hypothetical protein